MVTAAQALKKVMGKDYARFIETREEEEVVGLEQMPVGKLGASFLIQVEKFRRRGRKEEQRSPSVEWGWLTTMS